MFWLLDPDNNGICDALEFMSLVAMVSAMEPSDKVKFIYTVYDFSESGELLIDEITLAVRPRGAASYAGCMHSCAPAPLHTAPCAARAPPPRPPRARSPARRHAPPVGPESVHLRPLLAWGADTHPLLRTWRRTMTARGQRAN